MGNKVDARSRFTNIIKNSNEKKKEKQILEEAQEALRDFDGCFMLKRPSCEELTGNTISCLEMDLFELYMSVLVKELKHGVNTGSVVWNTADISGKTVVYPYIEEIWDAIVKEYGVKTCPKRFTDCVFSRRVKRCGIELQDKNENTSAVADLICCINGEEARENKYDDLIALLCVYSKELYDIAVEHFAKGSLLSGVIETVNEILSDYNNQEIKSEPIKGMYDVATKRWKKSSEKFSYKSESCYVEENYLSNTRFWDRVTVCSKWKDYYYIQSGERS